jgi:FkbM family methyltransferase
VWGGLARLVSAGACALRRRPGPASADEWRAAAVSYSDFGEDLVVLKLLGDRVAGPNKGVYVDVGAYDAVFSSNTLLLRQHGWTGMNIDANPDRIEQIRRCRPDDVCVWAVVSDTTRAVRYVRYPTQGLNQLIEVHEEPRPNDRGELPTRMDEAMACTLTELLDRHLPTGTAIDFLDVDCEGQDLNILTSLDWSRWRPRVVAAEAHTAPERERLVGFMRDRGYEVVASFHVMLIFAPPGGEAG